MGSRKMYYKETAKAPIRSFLSIFEKSMLRHNDTYTATL